MISVSILKIKIDRTHISLAVVILMVLVTANYCSGQSAKQHAETLFSELDRTFQNLSTATIIRQNKISPVNGHFTGTLKNVQPIHSLIRTNTKGVIINEVIRGERARTDYRGVATQKWFKMVVTKKEPYYGYLKENNGRFYLFWARPIFSGTKKNMVTGTIAMKVDLWDCFQKIIDVSPTPFSVRIGNMTLYSFRWSPSIVFSEHSLIVPGVQQISIRLPNKRP